MAWLSKIWNHFIEARTRSAEIKVAEMLHRTEYRNESFDTVLFMVRAKRLEEL